MADNKTQPTEIDPVLFINSLEAEQKKADALALLKIFEEETGQKPLMWGPSMIGFGEYHYKYESGREGDFFACGFSPRKAHLVLYLNSGFSKAQGLYQKLGKYKTSVACIYIKKLSDVNEAVLREYIREAYNYITNKKW